MSDAGDLRRQTEALNQRLTAERRLRRSLMVALDLIPQKVCVKDGAGRLIAVNRHFAAELGLGAAEVLGKTDEDLYPPDLAEKYRADDRRIVESGRMSSFTEEHRVGDERHFVEVVKMAVQHQTGRWLVCVFSDVTARQRVERTEEQLKVSERLLDAILHHSPTMIWIKDAEGRYLLVNHRYETLLHRPAHEILGKTSADVFPPEQARRNSAGDDRVLASGEAIEQLEKVTLDDAQHTFLSQKFPIFDENRRPYLIGGIATDITDRDRASARTAASERRYRSLFENANDVVYTHDLQGHLQTLNHMGERVTGLTRVQARRMTVYDLIVPQDRERMRAAVAGLVDGHPSRLEVRLLTQAGKHRLVEVSHQLIRSDGEVAGIQGIARDVTERFLNQRELRQRTDELENARQDLLRQNREIKDTETQLIHSEKMAAIGQLVAGLAHEINNPAAYVLTGFVNLQRNLADVQEYLKAVEDALPEIAAAAPQVAERLDAVREEVELADAVAELDEQLAAAQQGMRRIRDLVANLRTYARIDAAADLAPGDLREALDSTIAMLRPLVGRDVIVSTDLPEDLPDVPCHLAQMNQVFMNLIHNATQAVGPGGHVRVGGSFDDRWVRLTVDDDGPGVDPRIAESIFDPFFTTKEAGKGTGLGLSISRKIVVGHGGALAVSRSPQGGARFEVALPRCAPG